MSGSAEYLDVGTRIKPASSVGVDQQDRGAVAPVEAII
jgi:hypothetical protein